ncbi:TetR/AcrR family transcriptional regulator [Aeromonas diversa]|uniref:HTH tetR-type domain-containing protein n=1 Tax=Aeromonas diversa CDC 2478-85 TaxID=1268237 RepID=N9VPP1_9GAMM|nr:TetR/AcrR family transcriptional regulator [Aeromonas diversa]ENY73311.1 hypothetical protein G114_03162 [Aeromonas diversa CDC 2478-85]
MRPSSLEKRQRYLASAIELFLEQGYDDTNMAQIIERCGGSKLTLYNYFGDKQGLLRAVVAELTEPLEEALAFPTDQSTPRQQLMALAVNYLHLVYDERRLKLCRLVMTRVHKDPDLIRFFLERSAYHSQSMLGTFLKALDGQGIVHLDDPELACEQLLGALRGNRHFEALYADTIPSPAEMRRSAESAVDAFLAGHRRP